MKVSIITVTYNCERTIADTLRSVAAQTHVPIEHIIVDGASSDATLQRIGEHGAHDVRVVSGRDHGIYDAMNKGIALATGELIGFLNADDMLASPRSVAQIVEAVLDANGDAAYGDLVYVRAQRTNEIVRSWRSGIFRRERLRFGWMPPHPTFYVRRRLLAQVGRFDDSLRISADYDFMLRCLSLPQLRIVYVPEVLVRMRTGGASNGSIAGLWRKSREDLQALRRSDVGGFWTLLCKNVRKLPQFWSRPRPSA